MLSKFSVAANILPYFSFADKWPVLMKRLSKKHFESYQKHSREYSEVERSHFGNREKLLELQQRFSSNVFASTFDPGAN